MPTKQDYVDLLKPILEERFPKIKKQAEDFLERKSRDYINLDVGMICLNINYMLYTIDHNETRIKECADFIRLVLKVYVHYRDNNINFDKTIINRMFGIANLCKMLRTLKSHNAFTQDELVLLDEFIVYMTDWIFNYPEWGGHNRASIRGRGMLEAAKTFPHHPLAKRWYEIGYALMSDNIGKWSIEDASTYHPIWVEDLIECEEEGWKEFPANDTIIKYFCDMITYITNPLFLTTEYGDGRSGTQWGHYLNVLEYGAKKYNNGTYKYVANRIFNKMKNMVTPGSENLKLSQASALVNAYYNCTDIEEAEPFMGSLEVLDDIISKKIVFKNGLDDKKSTFLFLNYKDEIENGVLGRRNLDHTIVAPAEKNHHGHTDENSINLLTYKDSMLLHDGGYREKIDLLGAWRSDFYHNKLIIRDKVYKDPWKSISLEQYYNKVKSEKLYFYRSDYIDVSRTRVKDFKHNSVYDRCINYLKEDNLFVVVDILKSTKKQKLFLSNQYYSQNITKIDEGLYQTYYEAIGSDELKGFSNPTDKKLVIYYPKMNFNGSYYENDVRRSYQTERIISKHYEKNFEKDEYFSSVSILVPNDGEVNLDLINSVKVTETSNGVSVSLDVNGRHYELCHKLDEIKNYDVTRKPMYSFETTSVKYKDVHSDAMYIGVCESSDEYSYNFVAGSKVLYKDEVLFEIEKESDFYQPREVKAYRGQFYNHETVPIEYHIGSYNYLASNKKK